MNITIRNVRMPSSGILTAMYGTDDPLDCYALEKRDEGLESSVTLEDAVRAVVDYAEILNRHQKDYNDVSPYGGLDVTVQAIDEIALSQEDILKERFPGEDILHKIVDTLKERGHALDGVKEFCEIYDESAALEKKIKEAWRNHKAEKARAVIRQQRAEKEYAECCQALDREIEMLEIALTDPMLRVFRRKKKECENRLAEITALKEDLSCGTNLRPISDDFMFFYFPWEKYDDLADPMELHTKEDMDQAISCAHDYVTENRETYEAAKELLSYM